MIKTEAEVITINEALSRLAAKYGYEACTVRNETGRRYRFRGLLVGEADTHWIGEREQTRWTETELYVTEKGKYVLAVEHVTCWQGEMDSYTYSIHDSLDEIEDQHVLDDMRTYLCEQLDVEITLAEVARELPQ